MTMLPTSTQSNLNTKKAVIAFQQPQARQLKHRQCSKYKLRTTTTDATSQIYELSVLLFDNCTPKEQIKFRRRLQAVLKG
eukprot:762094-Ditylum_brightwellii.AAC.1